MKILLRQRERETEKNIGEKKKKGKPCELTEKQDYVNVGNLGNLVVPEAAAIGERK